MAIRVVDDLEVVDVYQGHRQRGAGPAGPDDLVAGLPFPGAGVQQSGLGVKPGVIEELRMSLGALQQGDERQGEGDGKRATRYTERYQDCDAQLGGIVMQRLTRKGDLAHADCWIRCLDCGQHEALVDYPTHHCAGRHCQYPRRRAGVMLADVAEYACVGGMEGDGGAPVGQSDGSRREDSPVDLYLPAAPLHPHKPRYRHEQRVDRRQQDRNRQLPDGVYIQNEARVLTCPAGHLHREEAAGKQSPEHQQLAWAKDSHRGARADRASVKDNDRDDEHNQPAGIYAPDWPRADSQSRAHSAFTLGEAHELLRDELAGVLAKQRMADLRGVASHCGRLCALFVKASLLTVNKLDKTQSSDRTVTSCHNLCKLATYWSDVGEHAH